MEPSHGEVGGDEQRRVARRGLVENEWCQGWENGTERQSPGFGGETMAALGVWGAGVLGQTANKAAPAKKNRSGLDWGRKAEQIQKY